MKKVTNIFSLVCSVAVIAASGCSKQQSDMGQPPKSVAAGIEGTWQGEESGVARSLTLSGNNLEFHDANTNEWYKGTFTLNESANPKQMIITITDCPAPQYIGKTGNAIYKIENGMLTITGCEPGTTNKPAAFNEQGARTMVFKAK